jgi:hypothetical protein
MAGNGPSFYLAGREAIIRFAVFMVHWPGSIHSKTIGKKFLSFGVFIIFCKLDIQKCFV